MDRLPAPVTSEHRRLSARRLAPEQVDELIELRLSGHSVNGVAAAIGCDRKTVLRHWHKHLDAIARERVGRTERHRAEAVVRLTRIAEDARRNATHALDREDDAAAARYLALERQALMDIAKLEGVEVQRVEHSGVVAVAQVTIAEVVEAEVIDAVVVEHELRPADGKP